MKTATIRVNWQLTTDAYRNLVAVATGPVPTGGVVEVPVGDLSPEARLAILELKVNMLHDGRVDVDGYYDARNSVVIYINDATPRSNAPGAEVASGILLRLAVERREYVEKQALAKEAKEETMRVRLAAEEAERAAKKAINDARIAENDRFVSAFLAEHGTESQRERHAAGALPESELRRALEKHLFAWARGLKPFVRLTASDLGDPGPGCEGKEEEEDGCGHVMVEYDSHDATEVGVEEWEALKAIRGLAPAGATITLRAHSVECACSYNDANGVLVIISAGGRDFRREFAVG